MNQIANIDLRALGLTYEEYLQIIYGPDIKEEKVIIDRPVSLSTKNNSLKDIAKKEKAEKEAKELEASQLLIKEMLEADGEDPNRIKEILKSLTHNSNHENKEPAGQIIEEEKFDGEELYKMREERNRLPPTMRAFFDCLSLKDKEKFLKEMKQEKEDLDFINQVLTENMQEDEDEAMQGDCPICLDSLSSQAVFPLNNCGHLFHIGCLETYFVEEIKKRTFPIKCPNPDCKIEIPGDDIKDALKNHVEYQDLYDEYYIKSYLDSRPTEFYQCPTPDCKFICSVEGVRFDCPECQKTYCVECKADWHHNMSCRQFQDQRRDEHDERFERYAHRMKYKGCPRCRVFVERIEGCNAMVCSRCQTPFCYECGREGDGHTCTHGGYRPPPRPILPNPRLYPFPGQIRRPNPHPIRLWRRPNVHVQRRPVAGGREVMHPKVVNIGANFPVNLNNSMQARLSERHK